MAKVTAYVYVTVDGQPVLLTPGDAVPDGVEVTNPDALGKADEADEADEATDEKPSARRPAAKKETAK